jgi:hypothetical protein
LQAILSDYQKVAARVEQVRNPTYLGDLHDNLNDLESEVKTLEKENKYKLIANQKRDNVMDKIL